jgi:peptidoglycan/xylan/chitin deacetylase (PgdA/CDA1 family)
MGDASTYPSGRFASGFAGLHRRTLRDLARDAVLSLLGSAYALSGLRDRMLRRPRVHILYLHHVFPDEEAGFEHLIEALATDHTFISFSDAVGRIRSGSIDRPYVAFTFDDGFKSCLRAAQMLQERGIHACFFVCPDFAGESDPERVAEICREVLMLPPVEFMNWSDIEQLRSNGHEIGSHTMRHARAADADEAKWREDVGRSREELQRRLGRVDHFAWPYGRFEDVTSRHVDAVFEAGYTTCSSAVRGCHVEPHRGEPRDLALRRDQIVAGWPLSHSLYFLARAARVASAEMNDWPEALRTR